MCLSRWAIVARVRVLGSFSVQLEDVEVGGCSIVQSLVFVVHVLSLERALARARERAMRTTMNAVDAVTEVFMSLLWLFGRLIFGLCACAGLSPGGLSVHVFNFPSILGGMLTNFDDRVLTLLLFMFDCFRE